MRRSLGVLAWAVITPALLIAAGATASSVGARGTGAPQAQVAAFRAMPGVLLADLGGAASSPIADVAGPAGGCRPVGRSSGYVDPLAGDRLIRERIDQGVDYAGSGTLASIGRAQITFVGTANTGWPGAFIEYRLLRGPDAGCFIYYAEGVTPVNGLHPGQTVRGGQPIATIIQYWPTGIELGWGAGTSTKTYAALAGGWTAGDDEENFATPAGRSFSALIAGLGGPPGKIEG